MRLSAEQVKQAILHADPDVREAALFYFSQSYCSDPAIMSLVMEAVERYGWASFRFLPIVELVQSSESVAWLIRAIEQADAAGEDLPTPHRQTLAMALCQADPAVLAHHQSAIQAMRQLDALSKEVIADRIVVASLPPDYLWQNLTAFCEAAPDPTKLSAREYERIGSVVDTLSLYPEQVAERVLANLADAVGREEEEDEEEEPAEFEANELDEDERDEDELNQDELEADELDEDDFDQDEFEAEEFDQDEDDWLQGFMIRLAGKLRLESVVPNLLDQLDFGSQWSYDEAQEALARIGTDAVVEEIEKLYDQCEVDFRRAASAVLASVHSDLSVQKALELFDWEEDFKLQRDLLKAALMNFSSDGIEPARQFIRSVPKTPETVRLRAALLVVCKMTSETFPEFEAWLEDSKTDDAFRATWYEDRPFEGLNGEFDDEDVDYGRADELARFAADLFAGTGEGIDEEIDEDHDQDEQSPPHSIVRNQPRVGRNDPCPCGSGKKFKKCCYGKPGFEEPGEAAPATTGKVPLSSLSDKFPVGTVAVDAPDDKTVTKIVAGVIKYRGADPVLERWVGTSIKHDPKVKRQIQQFFARHNVKNIAASAESMGCPHEEGEDFPVGEDCPFCPFWAGKQGSNRRD